MEGIFAGFDIRKLLKDKEFLDTLKPDEKKTLDCVSKESICKNFLGNNRNKNFKTIVSSMLTNFGKLECLMSLGLFSNLDYFPKNVRAFSEEMGERFQQDFKGTLPKSLGLENDGRTIVGR